MTKLKQLINRRDEFLSRHERKLHVGPKIEQRTNQNVEHRRRHLVKIVIGIFLVDMEMKIEFFGHERELIKLMELNKQVNAKSQENLGVNILRPRFCWLVENPK
jgi:hypothetical protein